MENKKDVIRNQAKAFVDSMLLAAGMTDDELKLLNASDEEINERIKAGEDLAAINQKINEKMLVASENILKYSEAATNSAKETTLLITTLGKRLTGDIEEN